MNARSLYVAMGISNLRNGVKPISCRVFRWCKNHRDNTAWFTSSSCPFNPHFFTSDLSELQTVTKITDWRENVRWNDKWIMYEKEVRKVCWNFSRWLLDLFYNDWMPQCSEDSFQLLVMLEYFVGLNWTLPDSASWLMEIFHCSYFALKYPKPFWVKIV